MAWRIQNHVVRGEIDNRQRGRVSGQLWLKGLAKPVLLQLKGNASPDLAGCLLTFENTGETFPMRTDATLAPIQAGTVGDLTASRKVRVLENLPLPGKQRRKRKKSAPERLANCLYLEWFSEANGRVVIESTDYKLTISPPVWTLTPEEESRRQLEAAEGFNSFIQKLDEELNARKHEPPQDKEWDEFDYEKLMRESDARTDKYGELLDKYQDHPDRDRIIAREMGWTWLENALDAQDKEGATPPAGTAPESKGEEDEEEEDSELKPDPATEGVDWVRDSSGYTHHPLCARALNGSVALLHKYKELGLEKSDDENLWSLLSEYQITGAKLAGALNGLAYGRNLREGAFIVACLKRALDHLHAAQAALEKVASTKLLPAEILSSVRADLFGIREETLRLMEEFRRQP